MAETEAMKQIVWKLFGYSNKFTLKGFAEKILHA